MAVMAVLLELCVLLELIGSVLLELVGSVPLELVGVLVNIHVFCNIDCCVQLSQGADGLGKRRSKRPTKRHLRAHARLHHCHSLCHLVVQFHMCLCCLAELR